MAVGVRLRFEVFKRDDFMCRYCGRRSPEVVLEIDHIVPISKGGGDDEMNLLTSCWECNRGKSDVPLSALLTGSDPHDKAIALVERERQLAEYNAVMERAENRVQLDLETVVHRCQSHRANWYLDSRDASWLRAALRDRYSVFDILEAVNIAFERRRLTDLKYVAGILRGHGGHGAPRPAGER